MKIKKYDSGLICPALDRCKTHCEHSIKYHAEMDACRGFFCILIKEIIRCEYHDCEEDMEPDYGILKHDEGVDLMPGNIELSGLEVSLVNVMSRELVLRTYIEQQKERYDYILIDCMPSLGMITINAFACADSILIPVQAAYLPVKGLLSGLFG